MRQNETTDQLIRKYADMVYRLAFARMGTKYDADEIFQEVFLRYLKKCPAFHDEEHEKAWFLRVTVNCCNKMHMSAWRRHTVELEENLSWETPEDSGLYDALRQLPPKYREVIHLFYYEDMTTEQIAQALHRRSGTVRSQLTRAREMLRELLREENDDETQLSAYDAASETR